MTSTVVVKGCSNGSRKLKREQLNVPCIIAQDYWRYFIVAYHYRKFKTFPLAFSIQDSHKTLQRKEYRHGRMELARTVKIIYEDLFFHICFQVTNTHIFALHEWYIKCTFIIIKYQIRLLSVLSFPKFFHLSIDKEESY